jgi:hypothetical protein
MTGGVFGLVNHHGTCVREALQMVCEVEVMELMLEFSLLMILVVFELADKDKADSR